MQQVKLIYPCSQKINYFREVANSHGSVIGLLSYSIFSCPRNSVHKSAIPSSIAFSNLHIASYMNFLMSLFG
jgi:hypothetical protein